MRFIFTSTRECSSFELLIFTDLTRYNKGDKVLGLEFGDHIGDW
jgi:hypothetical protein